MLFSHTGGPTEAPAQLALITIMQFAEGLSDAQAADAVRARIDWKYALALDLTDPGTDASVLSEFRQRLITGHTELLLFETMLTRFREQLMRQGEHGWAPGTLPLVTAFHVRQACPAAPRGAQGKDQESAQEMPRRPRETWRLIRDGKARRLTCSR
jgi:hypothetical protein